MKTVDGSPEATSGQPPKSSDTSPDRHPRRGSLLFLLGGLWLVLAGVVAVAVAGSFDEQPTVRPLGREAPVNLSARSVEDVSAHNSPTLVRNPVRPANLAVSSRIDTPFFSCALHVSADAGQSWTQTAIPAPKGEEAKCFAPDVAFSADGTLYLSFVTLAGRGNVPNALWISKSTDGGRTLSEPKRVAGELTFQVRLAPDPRNARRIFLTWLQGNGVGVLRFSAPGNPIVAARSDDAGETWSTPATVNSAARGRVITPAPVVGRDGTLYVLFVDVGEDRLNYEAGHQGRGGPAYAGRYTLVMARSSDGATRWQESVVDDRISPIHRYVVFLAPAPSVAIDDEGRLYAAFQDDRLGDPDVFLWSLAPKASSWSGPKRVNDTRVRDGTWQYLPKLAVAPNGRLDVLYYDRRDDRRNVMNQASLQSSFDHGETFTPAVHLSTQAFDSTIGFGRKEGLPDLGSRLGLISTDEAAMALWTDTRAGTPETQKQDLAQAIVAFSEPPARLSDTAEAALRYGGIAIGLAGLAVVLLALNARRRRPAAA
jgi:hypothetical protein